MNGLIDKIPASQRHFLITALAAVLAYLVPYVESTYTSWNLPPVLSGAIGALLPYAVLWVTTLTQQYGYVGKPKAAPAP